MTNELKNHVAENPQISHVYFNDANEWQFYPKKGYNKVLTRVEVAKSKVSHESPVSEKKGNELTEAQKAWLDQMPKNDSGENEDSSVKSQTKATKGKE